MKKALLPALVAAIFATSTSAFADDRELLFGPSEPAKVKRPTPKIKPADPQSRKHLEEPKKAAVAEVKPQPAAKPVVAEARPIASPAATSTAKVSAPPEPQKPESKVAVAPLKPVQAQPASVEVKQAPVVLSVAPPKATAEPVKQQQQAQTASPTIPVMPALVRQPDVVTAAAPMVSSLPAEPAVRQVAATDAFTERDRLSASMQSTLTVGFFPSPTGKQDNFEFQKNYLPLANYLSSRSGALVNLVPERDLKGYRARIMENRYPIIFVNATLADAAIKANYVPVAVGVDSLAPAFIVKADSKLKSLEDLKGVKISWLPNAQVTTIAKYELANRRLVGENKYEEVGTGGYDAVVNAVKTGFSDVAVVRSTNADSIVKESDGKLRVLAVGASLPSAGLWVRKGSANDPYTTKFTAALLEVKPTGSGAAKAAAEGFQRGFGLKGEFRSMTAAEIKNIESVLDTVEKAFPAKTKDAAVDQTLLAKNSASGMLARKDAIPHTDPLSERNALLSRMREGVNIGFFPAAAGSQDIYSFQSNFMPLSNYLSEQTGALVTLVPERNVSEFIKRIGDNEYGVIVIGPSMAQAALVSGYLPVARAGDFVSPAFLVQAQSAFKTIEDLANKRIATVRVSDSATVGRWELIKHNVKDTRFEFFGSASEGPSILTSGAADAVLIRSSEATAFAKQLGADGKPRFRAIIGTEEVPAVSVWVRHDAYDNELVVRLGNAFRAFNSEGSEAKRRAFEGYVRGFGVNEAWQTSGIAEHTSSVEMIDGLVAAKQSLVAEAVVDEPTIARNRAKPITHTLSKAIDVQVSSAPVARRAK